MAICKKEKLHKSACEVCMIMIIIIILQLPACRVNPSVDIFLVELGGERGEMEE